MGDVIDIQQKPKKKAELWTSTGTVGIELDLLDDICSGKINLLEHQDKEFALELIQTFADVIKTGLLRMDGAS